MKRPRSVSVIAWILIVMSGISVITSTLSLNDPVAKELMARTPLPIPLQYALLYASLGITFVSGVAMLNGQNWARFLYVAWSAIGYAIGLLTSPIKVALIPGLVIFAVIVFFLFRPKANDYFCSRGGAKDVQGI